MTRAAKAASWSAWDEGRALAKLWKAREAFWYAHEAPCGRGDPGRSASFAHLLAADAALDLLLLLRRRA